MNKSLALCLVVVVGSLAAWLVSRGHFAAVAHTTDAPIADAAGSPWHERADPQRSVAEQSLQLRDERQRFDAIVIAPCTLNPIRVQDVASQLDGQIVEIPVALGQKVRSGACLAKLDDRKLVLQTQLLEIRANSPTDELIAKALFEEADAKVVYARKANQDNLKAVPELELNTYVAQRERYAQEMKKAREERLAARKELDKALLLLAQHTLTSGLDGEVIKIHKKDGETVKQAETVFRVADMDRLRIEGFCKIQNAHQLRAGMPVVVEPEQQGRQITELVGHTDTVTDLAVSADGKLIASASLDGKVHLWSWPAGRRLGTLPHPAAVHAVDLLTEADGNHLLLTGCDDGQARLWAMSARSIRGPLAELKGHEGPLRCVRLQKDGKGCFTAGDDRKIASWSLPTGRLVGWVHAPGAWKQSAHQGAVTCLETGPDNLLISAGTDNVQRVWHVEGARCELLKTHRGRGGDVPRLGLDPRGKLLLFDHGDVLRLLDPNTGAVEGIVQSWKNARFQDFACFAPSGQLILASSVEGRLGLWSVGGGFEVAHYLPPRIGKVKCAAFAPDEKAFFSGGTDHVVRAWTIPDPSLREPRQATLTYVGSELEQGTDLVRIQAEMANPDRGPRRLFPGTMVVLKILPQDADHANADHAK